MSGRKRSDNQAVLTELKSKLPENINLVKIVADFEASFWKAVKLPGIFPEIQLQGCLFNWTQAVWRNDYRAYQLGPSWLYNDGVRVGIGSELVWRSVRVGSVRVGLMSELV